MSPSPFAYWLSAYFFLLVFFAGFFAAFFAAFLVAMFTILPIDVTSKPCGITPQLNEDIVFTKINVKQKIAFAYEFFLKRVS